MKRFLVPVALGLITVYLALAVGVAGCLSGSDGQGAPSHHHRHSHVTHSAFCAWACQGNPTVSALVETPPVLVLQFVSLLVLLSAVVPTRLHARAAHSRAPPSL